MSSFVNELFDEIKSDLKKEIRTETKSMTNDAFKEIKDAIHPKKEDEKKKTEVTVAKTQVQPTPAVAQTQVQPSPAVAQTQVQPTLSGNEKVMGKTVDEYKEIAKRLVEKHSNNLEEIYLDPEYNALEQDCKEYIVRVYLPAFKQGIQIAQEASEEYQQRVGDDINRAQTLYNNVSKDGVITQEEDKQITTEGFETVSKVAEQVSEMAPKYLDKVGDVANDLSSRIENEELADGVKNLGEALKTEEVAKASQDTLNKYSEAFSQLADMGDTLQQTPQNISDIVNIGEEKKAEFNNDMIEISKAAGMTDEDINNTIKEGANVDSLTAADDAMLNMNKLGNTVLNENSSKEEITQAAKDTVDSALKMMGSVFK